MINVIEFNFNYYLKTILDTKILNNDFIIFKIHDKLVAEGKYENYKPDIIFSEDEIRDDNYELIFRQPIRRI